MNVPVFYRFLTVATLASAEWINNPRYGSGYLGGFQVPGSSSTRVVRCVPCDERRSSTTNSLDEYRGNGADNLGYDWSPKAWGGPAFPNKAKMANQLDDWTGGRGGRQMPGSWETPDKCQGCSSAERGWGGRYPERPRDWDEHWVGDRNSRGSSTQRPHDWPTTGAPNEATVTSNVLGIMYRNDKRLPVPWQGDGRSMRWDGFRNGIPWEQPEMDKRSWNEEPGFRPWDETGKGAAGWDSQGKGHYAASWSYGSPTTGASSWNRPWAASDNRRPDERGYGQGSSLPFGSSYPSNNYPQSSNNYPSSSSYPQSSNYPSSSQYPPSSNYPTDRPTYSTSSWRPTTGAYPPKNQYLFPTTSRPQQPYPEIIHHRPSYQEVTPRPSYQTSQHQPQRPSYKPQDGGASWNYQDRYDQNRPGQWTTPRPNQNYLPQSPRPTTRPGYGQGSDRPPAGVPSITIWNGQPNDYNSRPGSQPPKGYYTGFITEIHDSNYLGGNRNPGTRPSSGYPSSSPTNDRYPSSDRYPSNGQYPSSNGYPSNDRDRYPSIGGDRYPTSDRYPTDGNNYPSYESNRPNSGSHYDRPGADRYPSQRPDDRNPWYDTDRNKPAYGNDRYPLQGGNYPASDSHRPGDRNPWYDTDRNKPGYDKYPTQGSYNPSSDRYPTYDRYPDRGTSYDKDRYPSYDKDRYPSYDKDQYPNSDRDRYPNDRDRYPSRPGSSDHDRGPLPNSDSGSWNYGEETQNKDGTYKRSGGSYPSYKGGKYFTSSYLASASTPASSNDLEGKKPGTDETTTVSSEQFVPS